MSGQDRGLTDVDDRPGLKMQFSMRIERWSHFRMADIGRRTLANPRRRSSGGPRSPYPGFAGRFGKANLRAGASATEIFMLRAAHRGRNKGKSKAASQCRSMRVGGIPPRTSTPLSCGRNGRPSVTCVVVRDHLDRSTKPR